MRTASSYISISAITRRVTPSDEMNTPFSPPVSPSHVRGSPTLNYTEYKQHTSEAVDGADRDNLT